MPATDREPTEPCGVCGHRDRHRPPPRQRPDDPAHCERCPRCERDRSELGVPTSFRLVHLLLLEEVARGGPVAALQALGAAHATTLRRSGLVDDETAARWSDVVWLVHDLEDWSLVELHRVEAPVIGSPGNARQPVVAGVSLSTTGEALLRRTRSAQGGPHTLALRTGRPRPAKAQEQPMPSSFDTRPCPAPPGAVPPPRPVEPDAATVQELAEGGVRRLLLRDGCVLTQDPELGDLPRGDVLVEGEQIVAVGTDLPEHLVAGATVLDVAGQLVLPGFVDSHVHAWEGLLRGVAPTVDFGEYLGLTAFGYGPRYRPHDMYAGTLATALTALDGGTTTLVDNSHNALTPDHAQAAVEALLDAGVRGVHAVGSPFGTDLDHVPRTATDLRHRYGSDLLQVRLFDVHPTAELWRFARDEDLWVSSEVGPHTPGVDDLLSDLARQGLLGPHHALNHCYDLQDATWDVIRDSGAAVNLAPRSDAAFGLGSTVLPARQALSRGIPTGLSGDNEVSYGLSMFAEMQNLLSRTRSEEFRRRSGGGEPDPAALLTPADVLRAATLGGAANAGLADRVGSLTPGKQADIQVIRTDGVATYGALDPTGVVTAFAQAGNVDAVLVAGRLRKHRGALVGVDLPGVRSMVATRQRALWEH